MGLHPALVKTHNFVSIFSLYLVPLTWKLSSVYCRVVKMVADNFSSLIFLEPFLFAPSPRSTILVQPQTLQWSPNWLIVSPLFWLPLQFAVYTKTRGIHLTGTSTNTACFLQDTQRVPTAHRAWSQPSHSSLNALQNMDSCPSLQSHLSPFLHSTTQSKD